MRVCRYYLQGHCAFGSECRNFHENKSNTKQEAPVTTILSLLENSWDQLIWKGSPIWDGENPEPLFYGINLSMEELRWEFYLRPAQHWPLYQRNLENHLEEARCRCLRERRVNRRTTEKFFVPLACIFGTVNSQNECFEDITDEPFPCHEILLESSVLNKSQHNRTDTTAHPFNYECLPLANTVKNQNHNNIFPRETLHGEQKTPCSADTLRAKDYLDRYKTQLEGYQLSDIEAFLSPCFQIYQIPIKAPPSCIPHLL